MVYVVNPGSSVTMQFSSGYYYDVEISGSNFQYKDSQARATPSNHEEDVPTGTR